MSFRRSFRLRVSPLVFLALGLLAWILHTVPVLLLYIAVFALWWLIAALAQFSKRLTIDEEAIRMHGYLGGPITIAKTDVTSCRYIRMKPQGRSIDMFFVEIRSADGRGIRLWRNGWGRQRRPLFRLLAVWIAESSARLDERTRAFLKQAE